MAAADFTGRLPPHNRDAERSVLGGILRDPVALPDVQQVIRAESFYFDAHQKIYRALCELADENRPLDVVSLHDRLQQSQQLADVGGPEYLAELWEAVPTGANAEYHAKIVRDCALNRDLIHAATEILRDAYDRTQPADELLGQAEQKLFALSSGAADGDHLLDARELARATEARIDARCGREGPDGLLVGFPDLDQKLAGLKGGQLVVVGARPGCGKTALALAIALNAAADGHGVYFASLEMPESEIADRVYAMRSGVPLRAIQTGRLTGQQSELLAAAGREFAEQPFHLDDTSDLTASRLASRVRWAVRRRRVKFVVIDYLQLLHSENPKDPRHLQVGLAARRMKQLARVCDVPVLLLAQLNRASEDRPGGEPRLADLRESGEIEAHADTVLLLHPEPKQDEDSQVCATNVIVDKNRNGPKGRTRLAYRRAVVRFENVAHGIPE
jgi:replicative DNA helicase